MKRQSQSEKHYSAKRVLQRSDPNWKNFFLSDIFWNEVVPFLPLSTLHLVTCACQQIWSKAWSTFTELTLTGPGLSQYLQYTCSKLQKLTVEKLNLPELSYNFSNLQNLVELDIIEFWDTYSPEGTQEWGFDFNPLTGLTSLSISQRGTSKSKFFPILWKLTRLEKLDLAYSRLCLEALYQTNHLTRLKSLDLRGTKISWYQPNIDALTNLETLSLMKDWNNPPLEPFTKLKSLTIPIQTLDEEGFNFPPSIQELLLFSTGSAEEKDFPMELVLLGNLTSLGICSPTTWPSEMKAFTKLTNLSLVANFESSLEAFAILTNLSLLSLFGEFPDDISPLSCLTSLTDLELITDGKDVETWEPLTGLTNLTSLHMDDLWLYDDGFQMITDHLVKLTRLHLFTMEFTGMGGISHLTRLTDLCLEGCKHMGHWSGPQPIFQEIQMLTRLERLEIYDAPADETCLEHLSCLKFLHTLYVECTCTALPNSFKDHFYLRHVDFTGATKSDRTMGLGLLASDDGE